MDVYLFPLTGLSLQPGSLKPLNIFEPRYRQLLEDSLERKVPIALVYGHHHKHWASTPFQDHDNNLAIQHESLVAIRKIACAGHAQVVQQSGDGSSLVSIEGQIKLHIEAIESDDSKPYLKAKATELSEDNQLETQDQFLYKLISKDFQDWIQICSPQLKKHPLYEKMFQSPAGMIALYTDLVVKDSVVKQRVLEMDSLSDKVTFLAHTKRQERTQDARAFH